MGTGVSTGEHRAVEAAQSAISSPLLEDTSIEGAKGVLINITGGSDLTLHEVSEASMIIQKAADAEANIIFGTVIDPEMTEKVGEERKFRLYIETLSQVKDAGGQFLRWADIRLLRRMVRDMQFRNYSPAQTIQHWHLVRRSELRYIVPRLAEADAIVNSFLPFELPVMKHRLGDLFPGFIEQFASDPERADALDRARRVQQMFSELPSWSQEDVIPADSLLREFIGGSRYRY